MSAEVSAIKPTLERQCNIKEYFLLKSQIMVSGQKAVQNASDLPSL